VIGVFLSTVPKTWFIQQDTASMCTTITEQWWTPIFTHDLYNFNKVGLISWSEFQHQGKQTAHVNTRSWKRNRCFIRFCPRTTFSIFRPKRNLILRSYKSENHVV
jgi:hypothetical protein